MLVGSAVLTVVLVITVLVTAGPRVNAQPVSAQVAGTQRLTTTLHPGFNLIGWAEEPATPGAEAATALDGLVSFTGCDGPSQAFRSFGPGRLAFLNDLETLDPGTGLWVDVEGTGASRTGGRMQRGQGSRRRRGWRMA